MVLRARGLMGRGWSGVRVRVFVSCFRNRSYHCESAWSHSEPRSEPWSRPDSTVMGDRTGSPVGDYVFSFLPVRGPAGRGGGACALLLLSLLSLLVLLGGKVWAVRLQTVLRVFALRGGPRSTPASCPGGVLRRGWPGCAGAFARLACAPRVWARVWGGAGAVRSKVRGVLGRSPRVACGRGRRAAVFLRQEGGRGSCGPGGAGAGAVGVEQGGGRGGGRRGVFGGSAGVQSRGRPRGRGRGALPMRGGANENKQRCGFLCSPGDTSAPSHRAAAGPRKRLRASQAAERGLCRFHRVITLRHRRALPSRSASRFAARAGRRSSTRLIRGGPISTVGPRCRRRR